MKPSTFITFFHNALNAYNKMCEPILHEFDIPQVSFDILMFLENNPNLCTAQQISEFRNIKKNLVSVHVDKLVTAGYLQRGIVPEDRRKVLLSCTKKARPILDAGLKMQRDFNKKLTRNIPEDEWKIMKSHVEAGYKIANSNSELKQVAREIRYHHERWDGKGYPDGLSKESIPILSRVIAVVDSFDAMVNDRPYRKAMPVTKALEELKRCAGTQFDPDITSEFIRLQQEYSDL